MHPLTHGLTLSFRDDSPFSSAVLNADTGEQLYSISTQRSKTARNTTIRNGRGEPVAAREQSWWPGGRGYDNVTLHRRRFALEQWLPRRKKAFFSSVWLLPGPDKEVYHWHSEGNAFKLVDPGTDETLAQSHSSCCSSGAKLSLDVSTDALPMLDTILLSFVVLEGSRTAPVCTDGSRKARGGGARSPHSFQHARKEAELIFKGVERIGKSGPDDESDLTAGMLRSLSY